MEREPDRVLELFTAAVSEAGGAGRMLREGRLGWLPEFMASACTLWLQEQEHRDPQEIADLLGVARDSVENRLLGAADAAAPRVHAAPPADPPEREQIAGGWVRHARARHPTAH